MSNSALEAATDSVLPDGVWVFLVEDDEATRHSLEASFSSFNCQVRSFGTCEEFLAVAPELPRGCLFLDYYFEGLTGLGLLDRLREQGIVFPTVLFTGRFDGYLRSRAAAYPEVVAVLDKPLNGRAMMQALQFASKRLGDISPER